MALNFQIRSGASPRPAGKLTAGRIGSQASRQPKLPSKRRPPSTPLGLFFHFRPSLLHPHPPWVRSAISPIPQIGFVFLPSSTLPHRVRSVMGPTSRPPSHPIGFVFSFSCPAAPTPPVLGSKRNIPRPPNWVRFSACPNFAPLASKRNSATQRPPSHPIGFVFSLSPLAAPTPPVLGSKRNIAHSPNWVRFSACPNFAPLASKRNRATQRPPSHPIGFVFSLSPPAAPAPPALGSKRNSLTISTYPQTRVLKRHLQRQDDSKI